ncbi:MAG: hypothetical protein ACLU9S_13115 [Oscillospiraceae bacterium]
MWAIATTYEYAVFSGGEDEIARSMCLMAYVALNDAKVFYEERHDRGTFVKNILTDNILPGDIYVRAKELHFSDGRRRRAGLSSSGRSGRGDVAVGGGAAGNVPRHGCRTLC